MFHYNFVFINYLTFKSDNFVVFFYLWRNKTYLYIQTYIHIYRYKHTYSLTHTYYWAAFTATCTGSMAHKVLLSHTSKMGHLTQLLKHLRARHKQNHLLWISRKIFRLWHFKVLQKVSGLTLTLDWFMKSLKSSCSCSYLWWLLSKDLSRSSPNSLRKISITHVTSIVNCVLS